MNFINKSNAELKESIKEKLRNALQVNGNIEMPDEWINEPFVDLEVDVNMTFEEFLTKRYNFEKQYTGYKCLVSEPYVLKHLVKYASLRFNNDDVARDFWNIKEKQMKEEKARYTKAYVKGMKCMENLGVFFDEYEFELVFKDGTEIDTIENMKNVVKALQPLVDQVTGYIKKSDILKEHRSLDYFEENPDQVRIDNLSISEVVGVRDSMNDWEDIKDNDYHYFLANYFYGAINWFNETSSNEDDAEKQFFSKCILLYAAFGGDTEIDFDRYTCIKAFLFYKKFGKVIPKFVGDREYDYKTFDTTYDVELITLNSTYSISREACCPANVEARLTEINAILKRSEEYKTSDEQKKAESKIINLIAPREFGVGFVIMNADALVTNVAFKEKLMKTYMSSEECEEKQAINAECMRVEELKEYITKNFQ